VLDIRSGLTLSRKSPNIPSSFLKKSLRKIFQFLGTAWLTYFSFVIWVSFLKRWKHWNQWRPANPKLSGKERVVLLFLAEGGHTSTDYFVCQGKTCVCQPDNSLFKLTYMVFRNEHSCEPLNTRWDVSTTSALSVHGAEYYTPLRAFVPGPYFGLQRLPRVPGPPQGTSLWFLYYVNQTDASSKIKTVVTRILQNIVTCSTVAMLRWREGKCVVW
jgi:hypothetical protein